MSVRERQVEVVRVRVVQKVSYDEAVKRVVEEDGSRVRDPKTIPVSSPRPIESDRNNMFFSKVSFLALLAMVINCTTEMECKSQKIYVVVAAAEKYLGVQNVTAKELQHGVLNNALSG